MHPSRTKRRNSPPAACSAPSAVGELPSQAKSRSIFQRLLWRLSFCESPQEDEMVKIPREFVERLTEAVC